MTKLTEAAIEYERAHAGENWYPDHGAPFTYVPARHAFMTGAAAMAEIFATEQGPVRELLIQIAQELAAIKEELGRLRMEARR